MLTSQRKRRREKIETSRLKTEYYRKVLPKAEKADLFSSTREHDDDVTSEAEGSRKLPRAGHDEEPPNSGATAADSGDDEQTDGVVEKRTAGGFKYDPLFKAKAAARAKAQQRRAAAELATEKEKEVAKKQKARRFKARQYAKRSSKGQPLMATRMKDLLGKIQQRSSQ